MKENGQFKYDVAVSYESHSRKVVQEIVEYLESEQWNVFFDIIKRDEMLSEKLKPKLYQIYQNESLLKVLFITERYLRNEYTLLEARRSFYSARGNSRRVIVINFMEDLLPDEYKVYTYLTKDMPTDEIAGIIGQRIEELRDISSQKESRLKKQDESHRIKIINKGGIVVGDNANLKNIKLGQ